MAGCDDNVFDLAIVDPPYGIKQDGHRENNRSKLAVSTNYHKALWDQPTPCPAYFEELERVSVNQVVWGGNHLMGSIARASLDNGHSSPCWLVWDKHTSGGFADCELAYTSFKTAVRKFSYPWNGMIQGFHGSKEKNEIRIHPTQKPVALYRWILENYAKPGQRILDTHLGSASSAIAAHYFGCDFVGTELDPDYYAAAVERFNNETKQAQLFDRKPLPETAEQEALL
jgi:site-specific DNA-methyltransferase (adenine-specific)